MAKVTRQVIKIDEELCNGCGLCVPSCAEGAIQIIDGKAKLVQDRYCDGLGACLGECPQGALSFEERDTEEYDESAVEEHLKKIGRAPQPHAAPKPHAHHGGGGCPSAKMFDFRAKDEVAKPAGESVQIESELRQWPVKLNLVNPGAPYFQDADLLVAADCTAFAYGSLHPDFLRGKALVIGCPKFDDIDAYVAKLHAIVTQNNIKSVTVLHMEVPCCFGIVAAAKQAVEASGKSIPVIVRTVSLQGEITEPKGMAAMF